MSVVVIAVLCVLLLGPAFLLYFSEADMEKPKEERCPRCSWYLHRRPCECPKRPRWQIDSHPFGDWLKFAFPLIRRVSPATIADKLVSVQPMPERLGRPIDPTGFDDEHMKRLMVEHYRSLLNEMDQDLVGAANDDLQREVDRQVILDIANAPARSEFTVSVGQM